MMSVGQSTITNHPLTLEFELIQGVELPIPEAACLLPSFLG